MTENAGEGKATRFAIFRARDARADLETSLMQTEPFSPVAAEGAARALEAGLGKGSEVKVLFAIPGFSLVHAWFKSGFPLPRHTHNSDCLYYVLAGSLRIGHEELVAGDGFFVGSEAPYGYTPGPAGVEVLEFRATNTFNIRVLAENPQFWAQAVEIARRRQSAWGEEQPPSRRSS